MRHQQQSADPASHVRSGFLDPCRPIAATDHRSSTVSVIREIEVGFVWAEDFSVCRDLLEMENSRTVVCSGFGIHVAASNGNHNGKA